MYLLQVLQRLQQKRAALEKELAKLPSAPTSSKDVFHLCRGFERAFTHTVEVRNGLFLFIGLWKHNRD
jgi:hypothetical protein